MHKRAFVFLGPESLSAVKGQSTDVAVTAADIKRRWICWFQQAPDICSVEAKTVASIGCAVGKAAPRTRKCRSARSISELRNKRVREAARHAAGCSRPSEKRQISRGCEAGEEWDSFGLRESILCCDGNENETELR